MRRLAFVTADAWHFDRHGSTEHASDLKVTMTSATVPKTARCNPRTMLRRISGQQRDQSWATARECLSSTIHRRKLQHKDHRFKMTLSDAALAKEDTKEAALAKEEDT